jgi:hypothetical protein
MNSSLSLIPQPQRKIVASLLRKSITNIRFTGKTISFTYDGKKLRNKVKRLRYVPLVADWKPNNPLVTYDDDVSKKREILLLAIHESVEKYVAQKYGLSKVTAAHYVATFIERKVARKMHINWERYSWDVEFAFRKECVKDPKKRSRR